ncbi:hypothetical protein ACN6K9_000126 [Streptomyces sp. SAS_267]|uniref:hypothetical protein n=1 Tax=unclassified Streptomyces TaxID=2593676 RepID=UPI0036FCC9B2
MAFGYWLVVGFHLPSWNAIAMGEDCGKSGRGDAAGLARAWNVSLPAEADEVYHCTDGQGVPYAGMSHFLFVIPENRVKPYFQSIDVDLKSPYGPGPWQGFEEVAHMAGRDVSKVKRYESGSVSRGGVTYNLFVDEDDATFSAVYVEVISSG